MSDEAEMEDHELDDEKLCRVPTVRNVEYYVAKDDDEKLFDVGNAWWRGGGCVCLCGGDRLKKI